MSAASLHIVRNPYGYSDAVVRAARLHLADTCERVTSAALRVVSAHRAYPEDLTAAIDALSRVLCDADPQLATDAKD